MYFGPRRAVIWSGGTESAGVTAPSTKWFLAEGATGSFFTTFVLMSNPNNAPANVTLQYLLDNGKTVTVPKQIAGNTRMTVNIGAEDDPRLEERGDVDRSSTRTCRSSPSARCIGPGRRHPGVKATTASASSRPARDGDLAEGRDGGPLGFHTYILLANPQTSAASERDRDLLPRRRPATWSGPTTVQPTSRYQHRYARGHAAARRQVRRDDSRDQRRADHRRAIDVLGHARLHVLGRHERTGIKMTQPLGGDEDPRRRVGGGVYPGFQYRRPRRGRACRSRISRA